MKGSWGQVGAARDHQGRAGGHCRGCEGRRGARGIEEHWGQHRGQDAGVEVCRGLPDDGLPPGPTLTPVSSQEVILSLLCPACQRLSATELLQTAGSLGSCPRGTCPQARRQPSTQHLRAVLGPPCLQGAANKSLELSLGSIFPGRAPIMESPCKGPPSPWWHHPPAHKAASPCGHISPFKASL